MLLLPLEARAIVAMTERVGKRFANSLKRIVPHRIVVDLAGGDDECAMDVPLDERHRRRSEHPHACGENWRSVPLPCGKCGTSPRVWGKLIIDSILQIGVRNIPTRVGKTSSPWRNSFLMAEHPHACGENWEKFADWIAETGTSPRVWGKHKSKSVHPVLARNIPTRVGKTK